MECAHGQWEFDNGPNAPTCLFVKMIVAIILAAVTLSAADCRSPVNLTKAASLSCPPGFVPQGNNCVCADWPEWNNSL